MKIHYKPKTHRALLYLCLTLGLGLSAKASRAMAQDAVTPQNIESRTNQQTCYVQFSGMGRTLLTTTETGRPVPITISDNQPTDAHLKWTIAISGNNATLKNGVGQWLVYQADGTFATTLVAADATHFGWTVNAYYAAEGFERYQLLLPDQTAKAVGVRGGSLTTVAANSRYSVVLLAQEVKGAELPTMQTASRTPYYLLRLSVGQRNGLQLRASQYENALFLC